jgi:gliding motility-associated lipoprotein GldD
LIPNNATYLKRLGQISLVLISFCAIILSCNSTYTSKRKGYFHIDLPEHSYQKFERPDFPYQFEYPVYGNIMQDSTYFDETPENNYWINVDFPEYRARLFMSYKIIGGKAMYKIKMPDGSYKDSSGVNVFDYMVNDAFNLTNKNNVVASSIKDSLIRTPKGVSGVLFSVGGNAATALQFFLSDTTKHFIRGALYFDATPNADSVKPVQDFLRKDLEHLINSFEWKNNGR